MKLLCILALLAAVTTVQAAEPDALAALADKKEGVKQDVLGTEQAAEAALDFLKLHKFTIYTRNLGRVKVPPTGPAAPGNEVYAWGNMYDDPAPGAPVIGSFWLSALTVTTDPAASTEMRQVFIELQWAKNYTANKHLNIRRAAAAKAGVEALDSDDLELTGAEKYPMGGGILSQQLELAVSGGVGGFTGARGSVRITYNNATGVFRYDLALL